MLEGGRSCHIIMSHARRFRAELCETSIPSEKCCVYFPGFMSTLEAMWNTRSRPCS